MTAATRESVYDVLSTVLDPEVPVLDVVSLGIVRDVVISDEGRAVEVVITPTYSGCPAMRTIEANIANALRDHGWPDATIRTVLSPAWTTDWMTDAARERLREYGIAPPEHSSAAPCGSDPKAVTCPQCGSTNTRLLSLFGSTACKAMHVCNDCLEPFEQFKCI
ncbi:MAG: 1,2-phenylacetyl-CoA epoxidase subunit PaaD [Planctomycetota bacterium]